jgi:membrane associated rhomboid family serine protease
MPKTPVKKSEVRRREAHEARMSRLRRYVIVVSVGFVLSLPFTFLCTPGPLACGISANVFGFVSAALLGLTLGGLLRMRREAQAFAKVASTT